VIEDLRVEVKVNENFVTFSHLSWKVSNGNEQLEHSASLVMPLAIERVYFFHTVPIPLQTVVCLALHL
jgi:hypothetical protein